MAKPTPVASAEEAAALRRRLRRLVAAVAAGSADAEAFDEAAEALAKLRDGELGPRKDRAVAAGGGVDKGGTEAAAVPEQFLCPISSEIMRDPVVLASGQFHLRRDPHACCSFVIGDGCVICERRGHRVLRSCGAVEEWQGKLTVVRTTTDGEEQQAAIGSEIALDWVGAARAGWRCLLARLSMIDDVPKIKIP